MRSRGRRARPGQTWVRLRTLVSPLGVREFRLLWAAQLASTVGDWAARLALAVVVLARTDSATIMSLVIGASLAAWLGPGQLMSQLADLHGRRVVMVVSDGVRALVFGCLALPVPTWALIAGAALAGLATPPFMAARSAATRELLPPDRYGPAMALTSMIIDAGTVLGYALGGVILAVATPAGALLLNSATFLVSGLFAMRLPETRVPVDAHRGEGSVLREGAAAVFRQPLVRMAVGVTVLAAASGVGIESLVVVYNARDLHGPAWVPGVLLSCVAGTSFLVTALMPNAGARGVLLRAAGLTALLGAAVTAGGFLSGSPVGAVVGIVASGAFYAVIAPANVVVGPLLPAGVRASAFSMLMGVLVLCQSLGASGAGLLADHLSTAHAAALICLPAAAGGAWLLGRRRLPPGYHDDIETPLALVVAVRPAHTRRSALPGLERRQTARPTPVTRGPDASAVRVASGTRPCPAERVLP